jgi:K+-transporting ATPase ATPase B chain
LLLDKTGPSPLVIEKPLIFIPSNGVDDKDFIGYAVLGSLADETPEGKSIVELAQVKGVQRKT